MPTLHLFYALLLVTGLIWPWAISPLASQAATADNTQEGTPRYTVQTGDTVSRIAKRFGLSADALLRANDLQHPDHIAAGYVLRLPVTSPNATTLAASPGDPGTDKTVPTAIENAPRPARDAAAPRSVVAPSPQPKPFQSAAPDQAAPTAGTKGANAQASPPAPDRPPRNDVAAPTASAPAVPAPTAPVPAAGPADKNGGAAASQNPKNGAGQAAPSAATETNAAPPLEPETTAMMQAQRAVGVYTHPTLGTLRVAKAPNGILVTKDNLTIPMRHLLYGTYDGSDASGIIHSIRLEFNSRGEVEALQYATNGTGNITFTKNKK